jgi:hypothetical protein
LAAALGRTRAAAEAAGLAAVRTGFGAAWSGSGGATWTGSGGVAWAGSGGASWTGSSGASWTGSATWSGSGGISSTGSAGAARTGSATWAGSGGAAWTRSGAASWTASGGAAWVGSGGAAEAGSGGGPAAGRVGGATSDLGGTGDEVISRSAGVAGAAPRSAGVGGDGGADLEPVRVWARSASWRAAAISRAFAWLAQSLRAWRRASRWGLSWLCLSSSSRAEPSTSSSGQALSRVGSGGSGWRRSSCWLIALAALPGLRGQGAPAITAPRRGPPSPAWEAAKPGPPSRVLSRRTPITALRDAGATLLAAPFFLPACARGRRGSRRRASRALLRGVGGPRSRTARARS